EQADLALMGGRRGCCQAQHLQAPRQTFSPCFFEAGQEMCDLRQAAQPVHREIGRGYVTCLTTLLNGFSIFNDHSCDGLCFIEWGFPVKNHFPILDPLRFAAALGVAVFHQIFWSWAWVSINHPGFERHVSADVLYPAAADITWFGWVGVEVFF